MISNATELPTVKIIIMSKNIHILGKGKLSHHFYSDFDLLGYKLKTYMVNNAFKVFSIC